jgi:hypothetical protein
MPSNKSLAASIKGITAMASSEIYPHLCAPIRTNNAESVWLSRRTHSTVRITLVMCRCLREQNFQPSIRHDFETLLLKPPKEAHRNDLQKTREMA